MAISISPTPRIWAGRCSHSCTTNFIGGLEPFLPGSGWLEQLKPKPKLRVLDPDSSEESTEAQVDAILQKIQEHGRDSLTRKERRILEEASRQYQKRRH